jgi:hypothetical protein
MIGNATVGQLPEVEPHRDRAVVAGDHRVVDQEIAVAQNTMHDRGGAGVRGVDIRYGH